MAAQNTASTFASVLTPRPAVVVLGLCGGAMLLGTEVRDPSGVEGATSGLGLLPLHTEMSPAKLTRRVTIEFPRSMDNGPRSAGYGPTATRSATASCTAPAARSRRWLGARDLCWPRPSTGCSKRPRSSTQCAVSKCATPLEDTFDLLADAIEEHLDVDLLRQMTNG